MLLKEKDPSDQAIQELEAIARQPSLPKDTLTKVEKELKTLKAGNRGEWDSAYHINFYYREKPNWAVIHDLRIEYGGNVAQIDHLMINRLLDFYVLESKSYAYGLKSPIAASSSIGMDTAMRRWNRRLNRTSAMWWYWSNSSRAKVCCPSV